LCVLCFMFPFHYTIYPLLLPLSFLLVSSPPTCAFPPSLFHLPIHLLPHLLPPTPLLPLCSCTLFSILTLTIGCSDSESVKSHRSLRT
jgi:hypothetical protein